MLQIVVHELLTFTKIYTRALVGHSCWNYLRQIALTRRRTRAASASQGQEHDCASLVRDLRAIGLRANCDVLVHASLSRIGAAEGAATVFAAIREAIGAQATILAPAYPFVGTGYSWMLTDVEFDVRNSPSKMGALSEYIRLLPGAHRSAHPSHSVVAFGPAAPSYTARHHEQPTPAGFLSPFYSHMLNGGQILCLGTGIGKVTSYHVVEDITADFPVAVYLPQRFTKVVRFEDGSSRPISVQIADPKLAPWRVDNFKPKEQQILSLLREAGLVREGRIGSADCHVLEAQHLLALLSDWVARGITIYHQPKYIRWL